jgi:hypothetical protein
MLQSRPDQDNVLLEERCTLTIEEGSCKKYWRKAGGKKLATKAISSKTFFEYAGDGQVHTCGMLQLRSFSSKITRMSRARE